MAQCHIWGNEMVNQEHINKLAGLIAQTGMTRLEIVKYLGVHERTLYRWLAGEVPMPPMALRALELLVKQKQASIAK